MAALEQELRRIGLQPGTAAFSLEAIDNGADDFQAALKAENLPVDDLGEAANRFFRIRQNGAAVGYGGYELHGQSALLRSMVVLPKARGHGAGRNATTLLLQEAFTEGARDAYLLTETATPFFEKLGFARIERGSAPPEILATRQATSLCPASATLMTLSLAYLTDTAGVSLIYRLNTSPERTCSSAPDRADIRDCARGAAAPPARD
jgi:N-acetylglutamate synthase-like GNAT family acetyltransferase